MRKNTNQTRSFMYTHSIASRAQIGCVSGLVGGFAIMLCIFVIDANLSVIPGTFYKMIGIPIGLGGIEATLFGLLSHMVTAALIGTVFCMVAGTHEKLEITSVKKGAYAGSLTALAIYAIFFLPITNFVIFPMLDEMGNSMTPIIDSSKILLANESLIIIGSFVIHAIFGCIMGIYCGMVMEQRSK